MSLVSTAAKAGVSIDFSKRSHYYHTRKAHLLILWAEQFNKQGELNEYFIKAYFENRQDISNLTVLLNIAEELGLNRQKAQAALVSTDSKQALNTKITRYKAFNISSIPAFIFNENILISGSNSVQYFEKTLSNLINESSARKKLQLSAK